MQSAVSVYSNARKRCIIEKNDNISTLKILGKGGSFCSPEFVSSNEQSG